MELAHSRRAAALFAIAALSGLGACNQRQGEVRHTVAADPSAVVIGKVPGPPVAEPPGTTPVDSGTTEVSKPQEQAAMPLPGQPNDHSNLSAAPSQRAGSGKADSSPEQAAANAPSQKGQ
jgi:hypothetical protein